MYNMRTEFDRRFAMLTEDLTAEQLASIDEIITGLEMLKRTELETGKMPGGVDPIGHYASKMASDLRSMKYYLRQPKPDPAIAQRQYAEFQALYKKNLAEVVPLLPKKLVASANKDGLDVVDPDGTVETINSTVIARDPAKARARIEGILEIVRSGGYAPLVNEVNWLKDVGFMSGKSNELARWRFEFPSVDAQLRAGVLNEDGTASYDLLFAEDVKAVIKKGEIRLRDWTHDQVEELVDTLATVILSIQNLHEKIHRHIQPGSQYQDTRELAQELLIDNIGDQYILYRVNMELRMGRHSDNPTVLVEIPSNTVRSAKSVQDKLVDGVKAMIPNKQMLPVGGEVQ